MFRRIDRLEVFSQGIVNKLTQVFEFLAVEQVVVHARDVTHIATGFLALDELHLFFGEVTVEVIKTKGGWE